GDQLQMRVTDDGIGGIGTGAGGNGLGGMRERVARLGGTLAIDSPPRGGTRLQLRLPVAARGGSRAEPAPASEQTTNAGGLPESTGPSHAHGPPEPRNVIRILLAEDQAMGRGALSALLGLEPDIEVLGAAADGEDAWRELQR